MGRKGVWIAVAVVLVLAGAGWTWRAARLRGAKIQYRTETVQRGDIKVQVTATGTLQAVRTVLVGSQVTGTISALNVDFNDRVRGGQVLAQLDPTFLKAQVAQSRADLVRADVQVRQAERDSARVYPLISTGMVSQADVDASRTALDQARASRAGAQAALERSETNLRYATIISPIDGVVVSRDVDVGQTVAASLSAPTIYTIANDLKQMQLQVSVDEADIGMVKGGQNATFTVDAYPEDQFRGVVHQIRLAPQTVQNVVTYTVVILVDNPEEKLLPGMTANVSVLVNEADDVLKVPAMALRFRPSAGAIVDGGEPDGARRSGSGLAGREGGRPAGSGHRGRPGMGEAGAGPGAASGSQGGMAPGGPAKTGVLYVLDQGDRLRAVPVQTGLSDGTSVSVRGEGLQEGMPVVLGMDGGGGAAAGAQGAVNPFAPRFPGGGRR